MKSTLQLSKSQRRCKVSKSEAISFGASIAMAMDPSRATRCLVMLFRVKTQRMWTTNSVTWPFRSLEIELLTCLLTTFWKTETSWEMESRRKSRSCLQAGASGLRLSRFKTSRSCLHLCSGTCKLSSEKKAELMLIESHLRFKSKSLKSSWPEISRDNKLTINMSLTNSRSNPDKGLSSRSKKQRSTSKSSRSSKREKTSKSRESSENKNWKWRLKWRKKNLTSKLKNYKTTFRSSSKMRSKTFKRPSLRLRCKASRMISS